MAKGYLEVRGKEICLIYDLKIDDAGKCNNKKVYVQEVNMAKIKRYEQSTSKSKVEAQAARALLGKMRAGALGLVRKTAEQIWIWTGFCLIRDTGHSRWIVDL